MAQRTLKLGAVLALAVGGLVAGARPAAAATGYSLSVPALSERDAATAVQVMRTGAGETPGARVRLTVTGGGARPAVAAVDLAPVQALVTFPKDGTAKVKVDLLEDLVADGPKDLVVTLTTADGATTLATATTTIADTEQVFCGEDAATIVGTAGPDTLHATAGRDVIAGLGGDDLIDGLDANDVACGGPGSDVVSGVPGPTASGPITQIPFLSGGTGDDTLGGLGFLKGDDGNDTINCTSPDPYCYADGARGVDRIQTSVERSSSAGRAATTSRPATSTSRPTAATRARTTTGCAHRPR